MTTESNTPTPAQIHDNALLLERLHFALSSAHMGIWEWNVPQDSLVWDAQTHALFGTEPASFDGRYQSFLRIVHPDDRGRVASEIGAALEKRADYDGEFHVVRPSDGSTHSLRLIFKAHADAGARQPEHAPQTQGAHEAQEAPAVSCQRITGVCWDVTERRVTEAKLVTKRNLFGTLMNHLPDHIYFKDRESRFIVVNRQMAERRGVEPAEMIGKTDFDFFTEEHARAAFEDEQRIIQTGEPIVGLVEKETWPDGRVTWVSTTKMPLRNQHGEIIGTFGLSRDITEQRKMEQALSAERNLLRSVINNLPDPIYVKDTTGRYVLDNLAHMRFVGIKNEDDIVGKSVFDFFPTVIAEKLQEDDETVLRSGESLLNREETIVDAASRPHWFMTTKVPLRDASGETTGVVCIGRDITQKKLADERLAQLAEELRAKNQALEEDLDMARELQQAMLPQRFPCFPHSADAKSSAMHFYHFYNPSMAVSGDFYDVLDISDTMAGILICDVMGHGVRAAMVAAIVRALVGELKPLWGNPAEFLTQLNKALCTTLQGAQMPVFASAFYAVVDVAAGEVRYANAGHPLPMLLHHATQPPAGADTPHAMNNSAPHPLTGAKPGPALGLFEGARYTLCRHKITPHDVLLLFTDGLFEVEGSHGQHYDYPRLLRAVGERSELPTAELCRKVIEEVQQFSASKEFNDDVCLLAVEVDHLVRGDEESDS